MQDRPDLSSLDVAMLRNLPPNSLGNALVTFLDRYGFTPKDYPTPYTTNPDSAYILRRIRMSHDIWHTLLGLGIEGYEEVLLHAFSLAQTGLPSSVGIVALGAIKHMVLENRWSTLTTDLLGAYQRGRNAKSLIGVYWERHWHLPLDQVRLRYNVKPMN